MGHEMRCKLGPKALRRIERQTGLVIESATCRGNSDHTVIANVRTDRGYIVTYIIARRGRTVTDCYAEMDTGDEQYE